MMGIEQILAAEGVTVEQGAAPATDGGTEPALVLKHGGSSLTLRVDVDEYGNLCLQTWGTGPVAVWVESDLVLGGHEYEDDWDGE